MKMAPQVRGFRDGHWFYIVSQYVVAGALHVLADLHVEGMERCPPEGGVILAMNHRSTLDIPLIGAWGPRPTIFFAKSEVRQWPVLGGIGAFYGSIYARRA